MMNLSEFELLSAELIDTRRSELTSVMRVVSAHKSTPLENTAATMAVPVIYAHWEGFVKELLTLYLTYVEANRLPPEFVQPHIFAYSLKSKIKLLGESGSVERCAEFSSWVIETLSNPLKFDDKSVDTQSNLSYANLSSLCETLYIDVTEIAQSKRHINSLVHRRNNIAHTGRPLKIDE
ncbi:MAE_28990/MAE_18760 family HEPN-like nuclease, partial [Pseudomonas syringae]